MKERLVISVSGKGGVGKTTTSGLLSRIIAEQTQRSLLLVDADPVMNLPRALGVDVPASVGEIATQMRKNIDDGTLPASAAKQDILEGEIFEALIEGDRFDFLAMGRTEGEGCYCYVNRILTQILDTLTLNYEITLLRNVDILIIVIDSSRAAFEAALRIRDLAKEVHIDFKKLVVIGNRIPTSLVDAVSKGLEENDLFLAGMIPNDDEVAKLNYMGKPVFDLPNESPALQSVEGIAEKLGLLSEVTLLKLLGQ
ncbi:MAG: ATP-binding protein [Candidatus Thorarchaeota archaeon]